VYALTQTVPCRSSGLRRVDYQIHQHLLHLPGIGLDERQFGFKIDA
jgi:hypothetical protein